MSVVLAGGIAPGNDVPAASGVDVITARTYTHPALGARPVIRLVPQTLGPAEDQASEFLGFARVAEPVAVGTGQQRALGFPGWALVHDPTNGRHALAMVKELEGLARLAKSKPGNAEAGYLRLASTLDAAVPHFLPTFWEQAGRAYLAAENSKQAATCFGRAREAERIHALPVDEERLAQVHLEFALQGALSAKTLSQYGQELAARNSPDRAYAQFVAVARQRVAGGLPPHAGLAADLKRLAKAGGGKPDLELGQFVVDILWMPAVLKAAVGFWTSFQAPLKRLVSTDGEIRRRLLSIMPDSGWGYEVSEGWIGFLSGVGALSTLLDPADTTVSATEWVGRLAQHRERYWRLRRSTVVLDLLARLVPRLRAEARPIALFADRSEKVELDLLDLCLHEGLAVVPPRGRIRIDLGKWYDDANPGARDLLAVAADPTYRGMFRRGVADLVSRHRPGGYGQRPDPLGEGVLADLTRASGIRQSIVDWLGDCADRAAVGTLATLSDVLTELYPFASGAGMALAPAAAARLAALDPAAALGRTLRTGLVGEYYWPAYEAATAQLTGRMRTDVSWPYVVVYDEVRAVVVGPRGIALEHHFQLPAVPGTTGARPVALVSYVDGQLLVAIRGIGQPRAYWSGAPQGDFDYREPENLRGWHGLRHRAPTLVHVGDVTTSGARPWRAGDRRNPDRHPVATDGAGTWRCEGTRGPAGSTWRWREYNPHTGAGGRFSAPAFLAEPGLVPTGGTLLAAPPEFAASPLGYAGGLVGWRVRVEADGTQRGEGIDGRWVTWDPGPIPAGRVLVGALPSGVDGGALPVIAVDNHVELWTADGTQAVSRVDVGRTCPPVDLWHAMVRRDEAGSAALRALSDADAARLLDALRAAPEAERLDRAAFVVGQHLPAVTAPALLAQIAVEVHRAALCADVLDRLRGHLGPTGPVTRRELVRHGAFSAFDTGLTGEVLATVLGQVRAAGAALAGGAALADGASLAGSAALADGAALAGGEGSRSAFADAAHEVDWPAALLVLPALLYRAVAPLTDVDERAGIVALLLAIAETRLVYFEPGGATRLVRAQRTVADGARVQHPPGTVLRSGRRTAIVLSNTPVHHLSTSQRIERLQLLERSDDGTFGPVDDYTLTEDLRFANGDPEHLASVAGRVLVDGPLPWRPELIDRLAGETSMTRAEAALILAGLSRITSTDGGIPAAPARELLGLKLNEARAARQNLARQPVTNLTALLGAASSAEADQLWRDGPNIDQVAAIWREAHGDPNPEVDLRRVLDLPTVRGSNLPVGPLATPASHPWLSTDGLRSESRLAALTVALLWLAYHLPVGHPIRSGLSGAYRRVREVLADPAYSAPAYGPPTDPGLPALRLVGAAGYRTRYELLTHRVTGAGDPALRIAHRPDLQLLLEPSVEALMASIGAEEPDSAGRWPQDPRFSRPDLVAAVARRYGLATDPAAYYLQLLALPDPTDHNVIRWNGWSPTEFRAARATVAATPLVLTARRERAGRDLFLPGGWLPQREPNRPLERWKENFSLLRLDYSPVLGVILVDRPVAHLFRDAWKRVLDGDEPRYGTLGGPG